MSWADGLARVRVPATSANLGPGFDALGLALALHDEVGARVTSGGLRIEVSGEGAADVADAGEKHLVVRAMRAVFDDLGVPQPAGLALRCANRIPHGRGLGSSAAAIVAGVLAARALAGAPTGPADALPMANALEGHPDNVAPCLFGGLTIAWLADPSAALPEAANGQPGGAGPQGGHARDSGGSSARAGIARAVRLEPAPEIRPVVLIAPEPVSTEVARGLLPASVPHADAARNAGRAALLIAALTGHPDALLDATADRLHQDYRAPAMPATHQLVSRLRAAGVPAVVSGAGPSVLAFLTAGDAAGTGPRAAGAGTSRPGLDILDSIAYETGIQWRISPLDVERRGASVVPGA